MSVITYHVLALNCDRGDNHHRNITLDTFRGRALKETQKAAIHQGWRFYDHGTKAICPACTREGYKWKKENDK